MAAAITKSVPGKQTEPGPTLRVVTEPAQAAAMLDPARLGLLKLLHQPASAAELARQTGQPRQKINYHLRELEKVGLVSLVEERRKGNCIERIVRASASAYLVSPEVLGSLGATPDAVRDRFSSAYLVAVAGETIREVGLLRDKAQAAGKRLPTLSVQTHAAVASPEKLESLARELSEAVAAVVARHHQPDAPGARLFKVNLASYPAITRDLSQEDQA